MPRAFVDVDVCSWNLALTVRSVSPTYLPGQGVELAPAQGMWYTRPVLLSFSSMSLGCTSDSLRVPLEVTLVVRPFLLNMRVRGSVRPEK